MSVRRLRAVTAIACAVVFGLTGCANLPFLNGKDKADRPAAPTGGTPERAIFDLEVNAPGDLRRLLLTYLDLSRFQNVPETDSITTAELDRLVAAAPAQARALLETEGYFNSEVRITRNTIGGNAFLRVDVNPGPRALIEKWSVDVVGDLQRRAERDEEDAVVEIAALRRRWPLKVDDPFRQVAWSDAKNVTLARLRAEGYPAANWTSTTAHVDAQTNRATLAVVADSGPLFHLGKVSIEGLQRYDEASVRRLATFSEGAPYSEQKLLDYQDRLQKVGLFEGAVIEIDPNPANAQAAPVTIRVKELPLQAATVGIGYSANTGPRVTLEHLHRKVFGQRWIAKNKFEIGPKLNSWQGELTSHPKPGLYRNLVSGTAERLESADDEVRHSWSARVGRAQDTPTLERLYFGELTHSRVESKAGVASSDAATINYHWTTRKVDSLLLPTKGYTLALQGAVGQTRGREITPDKITHGSGPFSRAYGRFTWYQPFGGWYATVRTEAGQVFASENVGVPDTLLFRAGGDESVRGYAYRTLGPLADGVVTSGRVLWTGSAEIARPISRQRPNLWWAAFVDAGNAAQAWHEMDPAVGVGVGMRWRSPVGPLRLDLAWGVETRKPRVHMSVGVAF